MIESERGRVREREESEIERATESGESEDWRVGNVEPKTSEVVSLQVVLDLGSIRLCHNFMPKSLCQNLVPNFRLGSVYAKFYLIHAKFCLAADDKNFAKCGLLKKKIRGFV